MACNVRARLDMLRTYLELCYCYLFFEVIFLLHSSPLIILVAFKKWTDNFVVKLTNLHKNYLS